MTIERLRAYSGTIRELAREADLSPGTIIGLRDGTNTNPTVGTLRKIEQALDRLEATEQPAAP